MPRMTAPTVDTPLTTDIERVDAFIDKRCTGGTPECPCPHGSWDRITAALLAARREVEAARALLRDVVDAYDWWQVDPTDREAPAEAIGAARAALAATPEEK